MALIHYLAYGSNLHPARLCERAPSARLVGIVNLPNWRVAFHKRSKKDGSAKCDLLQVREAALSYGALYELDANDKTLLDAHEGLGRGYEETILACLVGEQPYRAFTYVASQDAIDPSLRPYDWYKNLVVLGARFHRFPEAYVDSLESVASIKELNASRLAEMQTTLAAIASYVTPTT